MKKKLTFDELTDLLILNEDLNDLQKKASRVLKRLSRAKQTSEAIAQLKDVLDELINFDLIDAIDNAEQ